MPIHDYGAVCDISVLTNQDLLKNAEELFESSGLYIPNSTYSWLSRAKLIEVRHQPVKYSLIEKQVRKRKLYSTHLPELYDEISRQIMFNAEQKVALTDLRGLLLAAHLQLPLLTFDENLIERISKEIGIFSLQKFKTESNWLTVRNILELYRELLFSSGKRFYKLLENGGNFDEVVKKIKKTEKDNIKSIKESIKENNTKNGSEREIEFHYLGWNIIPSIQDYYDQNILTPEDLRRICERCILLIANPPKFEIS